MTDTAKKILIVDDEPHMLMLIKLSLKKLRHEIITATDGVQAVALATQEKPDFIVMDVTMPELDGLSALKQLKAKPETAGIPVLMLTTRGQTITREAAQNTGAVLYLTKPFRPSALAAEVQRIIDGGTVPTAAPAE